MKNKTNHQNIKVGDKFYYKSTKKDVCSFEFTVFGINDDDIDIIINKEMYRKIKKSELDQFNVHKLRNF